MSTLATALSAIVILLVGGAIGFYLARIGQTATAAKYDEIQQEYDAYRAEVAEHFGKTADQFHAIGLQYRELYEHLAAGSAKLCELEAPGAPFPPALEAQDTAIEAGHSGPEADEVEAVAEAEEGAADTELSGAVAADDTPPADFVAEASDEAEAEDVIAEDEEPAPDNVVELVPRGDADDEADKQTYS